MCVSLWYWEIVKVTYIPVCGYQKEAKLRALGKKCRQQVSRGDVPIGPDLVTCVCHFIHSGQEGSGSGEGLSHKARCNDKMANMGREAKPIKACYLGMVLFLSWWLTLAKPLRIYAEEEGRMELQLGGGHSGSQAGDWGRVWSQPCFSGPSSALPLTELLSKEAVGLMSQDLYVILRVRERGGVEFNEVLYEISPSPPGLFYI